MIFLRAHLPFSPSVFRSALLCLLAAFLPACAALPPAPPTLRDTLADGSPGPLLAVLPAGDFIMGDGAGDGEFDEHPPHPLRIERAFALGVYEVTVAQFSRFADATGYVTEAETAGGCMVMGGKSWRQPKIKQQQDHPVTCVTWRDAVRYLAWLSAETGHHYRLPTEAEWEYAARAGSRSRYSWGDAPLLDRANCFDCLSGGNLMTTVPVGSYPGNSWGLHDMEGNVWEWTDSDWQADYGGKELLAVSAGDDHAQRVIRGGSFYTNFLDVRAANRGNINADWRYNNLGFRVARDL